MSQINRDACLTLVTPKPLEEQVVDHLLRHPDWFGGFTAYDVDGHGATHDISSNREQVRGRAGRVQIDILITAAQAPDFLQHLQLEFPGTRISWRITPVIAAGEFA